MNNKINLARGRTLDFAEPVIMGIVNVTPDSFSDGGQFLNTTAALSHAMQLLDDGATILDIGGESTRPGAPDVSLEDELKRVIPIIKAIREQSDCVISIDTSKAEVMRQAIEAGADIVNDVRALQEPGAIDVVAQFPEVAVCLMHMQGQPRSMQHAPHYNDLAGEINDFFSQRIAACEAAGIKQSQLILDPGFGFGKTLKHNYQILAQFNDYAKLGLPLLAGLSRKSMIGKLLNRDTDDRLAGSLAGALIAAQNGAHIIRVHDVKETADVLGVYQACKQGVL
ncbi:MAG: dihydropteroate synthase [Pseudoalteromonas tetraodonis]|jgi:dihydropteroate synthase|uniref:Dihydropteroate synthase n=3 Tax=Pseudoalteromonas TaxID=53246 RepID=A0A9W4VVG2_PSEHA|nr:MULTISPECIES: dihydropteroate synthase [Pseudoalteromonas]ADT69091.1 dihydropteroate synthase [Pseudoalteromonas sp. SM9913]ATD03803.1 dihydropteroate synthase [Pseudoalteromonas tetraodonis]EWS98144.1 dihydropteroate synthase [Pseudoalteromonas sp. SCSIO_11900]KYL37183.1 dihydropteroate synthase [Pseudoalteromonas spiralis]MBT2150578.1 dihydropteroate synthase [Pseudoalteromonas tetraodonis]|tara:strand:+ start:1524 stop:2369 length:846 start_codon:yes stop_codon:yes gene_type:complete